MLIIIKYHLFNIIMNQATNSHMCLTLQTVCTAATQLHHYIGTMP